MGDMKRRPGRMVWCLLLSVAAACLASGAALATCTPTLPITAGSVPCYIKVQPIDVGQTVNNTPVFAPFNTTSQTGNPSTAGQPFQPPPTGFVPPKGSNIPKTIPNNSKSPNPIGFVVDPATGLTPGQTGYSGTGVDVTRTLLNNIGVELVWLPMTQYVYPPTGVYPNLATQNFTKLSIALTSTGTQVAGGCQGFISGTTLTITSPCTSGALAVYDILSGTGIVPVSTTNPSGTFISALGTGSGGVGTYTVNISQTAGSSTTPISLTAVSTTLGSQDFLKLADQVPSTANPPAPPCSISQMTIPPSSPCGSPSPSPPLSLDPGTINLFFVNNLNPPTNGGTLYGFSLIGNNGVAIGGNTFFAPTPLQARPDTIAHELLHTLGLDHTNYGAGPWTAPTGSNGSYIAPAGVAPPIPLKPLAGECDPAYPACGANLMTTGSLRTEPTLACVLAGVMGDPVPTACTGLPSLANAMADRVTPLPAPPFQAATSAQLPVPQQKQVLNGGSGLLLVNSPLLNFSGLIDPIPYETTKAQLHTGGSSTDGAIFDLSGPTDGKPGETLVAWVLTLPQGGTFAGHDGFHIASQSRRDLVEDVKYYPNPGNNPRMRKIAYYPGGDNDQDNSPCASATAECLVVKFQAPGLEEHDWISFSNRILSGDASITNDDLCKAKITYIFSDGFVTTSNFGRCPPASLPLIASSWHPDPHVAPYVIKSDLLLAAKPTTSPCTVDPNTGLCPDPTNTPPADIDYTQEGGQLLSCDNGATFGNPNISGTVTGSLGNAQVSLNPGQICNYLTSSVIVGSMIINGAEVYLDGMLQGNLTVNSGRITLGEHAQIVGNVQISQSPGSILANGFRIGNSNSSSQTHISGGLTIQNLIAPPTPTGGSVCNTVIGGNVTIQNTQTQSAIEIGDPADNCSNVSVGGSVSCSGNTVLPIVSLSTGKNQCSS